MKNGIIALIGALVACVVLAAAAVAGKPGPGTSTGTGSVFVSNPVQSLGDESLTDQKDSDAAVPAPAYYDVTLTNLDGSGFLHGDYATVDQRDRQPGVLADEHVPLHAPPGRVRAGDGVLLDHRGAEVHPAASASASRAAAINNRPQHVRINQWGVDNSFATDHPKNELRFGKGGVDDAEDAEVILHEYGHAIHFSQNFSFASEEAGAISEGFGDYWAVDRLRRRRALARRRPSGAAAVRRRLGLDVVHGDRAALPAAASTRTCTTRPT